MKAFPCDSRESNEFAGMDLRDYFAAKAMQALLARSAYHVEDDPKDLADESYVYADAMMELRK